MRYLKAFLVLIIEIVVFVMFYALILVSIALISAGALTIPLSLMFMSGAFTSVASDLSPPSLFLAGISCLSGGGALGLSVILLFPKQTKIYKSFNKL